MRRFDAENCRPAGRLGFGPSASRFTDILIQGCMKSIVVLRAKRSNGSFNPCARPFGHIFGICLYLQCIGVHCRVPNGPVVRDDVLGKGVGPAALGEAGRPAASAQHESRTCNLHNFCVRTPNWVNQMSNSIISTSSSTWKCQIWHLTIFIMVSSYIHISPSL